MRAAASDDRIFSGLGFERCSGVAKLGAHVSAAGGVQRAFTNARELGCEAFQLFVKNANRWQAKPLSEADVAAYRLERDTYGDPPVAAHASYLINLCATNPETLDKSRAALKDELERCQLLGIRGLVVHPGAHLGAGVAAGLEGVVRSLDLVLGEVADQGTQVWLENTAGQGTVLGSDLGDLAAMLAGCAYPERLGVCLDTCHAFAAGQPLNTRDGLEAFLDAADAAFGLGRLGCFHLNDSLYGCGSRRDRHANLGEGEIGLPAFVRLAQDARFTDTPMFLETPLGDDGLGHARDLERLRAALAA